MDGRGKCISALDMPRSKNREMMENAAKDTAIRPNSDGVSIRAKITCCASCSTARKTSEAVVQRAEENADLRMFIVRVQRNCRGVISKTQHLV